MSLFLRKGRPDLAARVPSVDLTDILQVQDGHPLHRAGEVEQVRPFGLFGDNPGRG